MGHGLLSSLGEPLSATVVVLLAVLLHAPRDGVLCRTQGVRHLGVLLVLASSLPCLVVARDVALPGTALESGDLVNPGDRLVVPPVPEPLSIETTGRLLPAERGSHSMGSYELVVWDGAAVLRHKGAFTGTPPAADEAGHGYLEVGDRFELPPRESTRAVEVRLAEVGGDMSPPLVAHVVPSPPSLYLIAVVGLIVTLAGAVVDSLEWGRTLVAPRAGRVWAFCGALVEGPSPTDTARHQRTAWARTRAMFRATMCSASSGLRVSW